MPTRAYPRPAAVTCHPPQLAAAIDTALSRTGTVCQVSGLTVTVTHPALSAADDATVQAQIDGYVYVDGWESVVEALTGRTDAKRWLSLHDPQAKAIRAFLSLLLDEINLLRAAVIHPISSITRVTTTATVTTPTAHGLSAGDTVAIFGAVQPQYNGVKTVATAPTGTTFTISGITGSPATPATGTILYAMAVTPPTPPRTMAQLRTAIENALDSGAVD